ncbi:hypothetical protein EDD16DRAFT_1798501 [Pisolithus croceorrhizus]|nr:hypothetical protein EV401DRAFT_2138227 [Pisolithus croceorrhizus]KAI6116525.1 hypothetical protein EDD16DRAFT_1798501 [Pisolithus croceorrhizus]KAI6166368.1 hypothetical protein EDD17DRAFT_1894036 [Pisolithus thermaeus]
MSSNVFNAKLILIAAPVKPTLTSCLFVTPYSSADSSDWNVVRGGDARKNHRSADLLRLYAQVFVVTVVANWSLWDGQNVIKDITDRETMNAKLPNRVIIASTVKPVAEDNSGTLGHGGELALRIMNLCQGEAIGPGQLLPYT